MKAKYIIGIDPSGAFNEGKGTTGLAVLNTVTNELAYTGWIAAVEFPTLEAYFDAHIEWLADCVHRYQDVVVSIEDYILYADHATAHTNTHLETSQLLGLIKWWCYKNKITYTIRPAAAVKSRFTNNILKREGYIFEAAGGKLFTKVRMARNLSNHELDAIRHAAYCYKFELKHMPDQVAYALSAPYVTSAVVKQPKYDYEQYVKDFAQEKTQGVQVEFDPYYKNVDTMASILRQHIKKHNLPIDCVTRSGRIYLLKL